MSSDLPDGSIDAEDRPSGDEGDERESTDRQRFLVVEVGDHRLAFEVDSVKTTVDVPPLTRIPRATEAIRGLTDVRGEIVGVVDPRVYFPTDLESPGEQRLVVLDRPADKQPAGVLVDEVVGVETAASDDVLDADDIDAQPLEHPLIRALVRQETRRAFDPKSLLQREDGDGPTGDENPLADLERRLDQRRSGEFDPADIDVDESDTESTMTTDVPEIEPTEVIDSESPVAGSTDFRSADEQRNEHTAGTDTRDGDDRSKDTQTVTVTPIVDVERLLLACRYAETV